MTTMLSATMSFIPFSIAVAKNGNTACSKQTHLRDHLLHQNQDLVLNSKIEALEKSFATQMAEMKARDDKRNNDIWEKLKEQDKAITEIKETRGAFTAQLKAIEDYMKQIPTQKEIHSMLKESEDRIEKRIEARNAMLLTALTANRKAV